jgi:hypothetical protein
MICSLLLGLRRFFSSLIQYAVGSIILMADHAVTWPLPTHKTTQTQNKHKQTSTPRVGFEPTNPAFERQVVTSLDCDLLISVLKE